MSASKDAQAASNKARRSAHVDDVHADLLQAIEDGPDLGPQSTSTTVPKGQQSAGIRNSSNSFFVSLFFGGLCDESYRYFLCVHTSNKLWYMRFWGTCRVTSCRTVLLRNGHHEKCSAPVCPCHSYHRKHSFGYMSPMFDPIMDAVSPAHIQARPGIESVFLRFPALSQDHISD